MMPSVGDQLVEISALKDGWLDGEGIAVSESTLLAARREADAVATATNRIPYLYPREDGGVSIEWDVAGGGHVNVEPRRP